MGRQSKTQKKTSKQSATVKTQKTNEADVAWLEGLDWDDPVKNPYYDSYFRCPCPNFLRPYRLVIFVLLCMIGGAAAIALAPLYWSLQVLIFHGLFGLLIGMAALYVEWFAPVPTQEKYNIPENHLSFVVWKYLVEIVYTCFSLVALLSFLDFLLQQILRKAFGIDRNLVIWHISGWPLLFYKPASVTMFVYCVVGAIWLLWTILSHIVIFINSFYATLYIIKNYLLPRGLKVGPSALKQIDSVISRVRI